MINSTYTCRRSDESDPKDKLIFDVDVLYILRRKHSGTTLHIRCFKKTLKSPHISCAFRICLCHITLNQLVTIMVCINISNRKVMASYILSLSQQSQSQNLVHTSHTIQVFSESWNYRFAHLIAHLWVQNNMFK